MTQQDQKSFGDFTVERFGRNWAYGHSKKQESFARNGERHTIIAKKEQKQLAADYAAEWGREHDPQFWAAICALRTIGGEMAKEALQQMGVRP